MKKEDFQAARAVLLAVVDNFTTKKNSKGMSKILHQYVRVLASLRLRESIDSVHEHIITISLESLKASDDALQFSVLQLLVYLLRYIFPLVQRKKHWNG